MNSVSRIILAVFIIAAAGCCNARSLSLIPHPKSIDVTTGDFTLEPAARIVAVDPSLEPLASILSDEILLVTGLRLKPATGTARAGDVVLALSDQLQGEAYHLTVTDRIVVRGGNYGSVAWGTVTLLQALAVNNDTVSVPCMVITDEPDFPYRGFMEDVARQEIPIEALETAVNLCRLYKVRYLHLHLSDDHAWVFPSTAYPQLGSANSGAHEGRAPKVYPLGQLKQLVNYADKRGVTLVPEIEGPGHSGSMRIPLPVLFDSPKEPGGRAWLGLINMANEAVYPALDTIIAEAAAVFASSPYIHIGCDEVSVGRIKLAKDYPAFIRKHNFTRPHDVFSYYVKRLANSVEKQGKKAIVWEGAALDSVTTNDVIVMIWTKWAGGQAVQLAKKGFTLINNPNYGFGGGQDVTNEALLGLREFNYTFDPYTFGITSPKKVDPKTSRVIGAQVNDWESAWDYAFPAARISVPARNAAVWNYSRPRDVSDFNARFHHTDSVLERLTQPIRISLKSKDTFDASDFYQRLRIHVPFAKPLTVTMSSPLVDTQIHYTLDGSKPSAASPVYTAPIIIEKTCDLRAALLDDRGKQLAPEQRQAFTRINYQKNLTTGKPVTVSKTEVQKNGPGRIADGIVNLSGYWGAAPYPQWAQIDLETVYRIDRIHVFPYWDGRRSYQYTVELSTDGSNWTEVVDMRDNTARATENGDLHLFTPAEGRYIKVTMLKNTVNPGVHLVEVRAYEPGAPGPVAKMSSPPASTERKPVKVFILSGQSNMEGLGDSKALPEELAFQPDVKIRSAIVGQGDPAGWKELGGGFGVWKGFGPEVTLGYELSKALPDADIYLVKSARSGTAISKSARVNFDPAGSKNEYTALIRRVTAALDDLEKKGRRYSVEAFFWMQGESDALDLHNTPGSAEQSGAQYETNLRALIKKVRADLQLPDLPVFVGRLPSNLVSTVFNGVTFSNAPLVIAGQNAVANDPDLNTIVFGTDDLKFRNDHLHYDTQGQLELGRRFAREYLKHKRTAQ